MTIFRSKSLQQAIQKARVNGFNNAPIRARRSAGVWVLTFTSGSKA